MASVRNLPTRLVFRRAAASSRTNTKSLCLSSAASRLQCHVCCCSSHSSFGFDISWAVWSKWTNTWFRPASIRSLDRLIRPIPWRQVSFGPQLPSWQKEKEICHHHHCEVSVTEAGDSMKLKKEAAGDSVSQGTDLNAAKTEAIAGFLNVNITLPSFDHNCLPQQRGRGKQRTRHTHHSLNHHDL